MLGTRTIQVIFWSVLCLLLAGCQGNTHSFVGFTFGGGGNTFSCEPAQLLQLSSSYKLQAKSLDNKISIELSGESKLVPRQAVDLSQAKIIVPGYEGEAALVSGQIVLQSIRGGLSDGSFELKAKTKDGRVLPVVGSFTAISSEASNS